MAKWLQKTSKKKQDSEPIEDFVLYSGSKTADGHPKKVVMEDNSFSDTDRLEIPAHLLEKKGKKSLAPQKKKLLWGIWGSIIALVLVVALLIAIPVLTDPLRGYVQAKVTKGNVISSMDISGTLSANAHYSITSLVSGTVIDAPVEVGDKVEAGDLLYQLDDTDAQLALKRAENQLEKSISTGSYSGSPLRIYAVESGVIQSLVIRSGYTVTAGQVIGTLKRADESVISITSAVSGTVSSVNVSTGVSVSAGTLIATVQDNQAEQAQRSSIYDQKSSEYDVEAAENHLNNYTILSPTSGVVTEKNAKVGDNVAMTSTTQPMMVITDTSFMRFTFQLEESLLSDVEPGMRVSVTTESVPNKTFNGTIKSISAEGVRNQDGKLMFQAEVSVQNPGTLKSGMNVSAKIIMASVNNTLRIPVNALRNPDGKTALVLVKGSEPKVSKAKKDERIKKSDIEVPEGYYLTVVQYGISDGTNVQILSGLKQSDSILYSSSWEVPDLKAAASSTKPDSNNSNSSADILDNDEDSEDTAASDEALRQEIMDRVRENQKKSASSENTEV